jgi:hypothetical protein
MFGKRGLSGAPPLLVALFLLSSACDSNAPRESTGQVAQAIVGGTTSDVSQDAVVMLVMIDPQTNKRAFVCTATLLAPRLVLTARHCVARTNPNVACDADGTPLLGGEVFGNHEPANFYVFTGKDRPEFIGDDDANLDQTRWKPAGQGLEILDDKSGTLCNHDLALLLLKEPVNGAPVATIRLDGEARKGEQLLTVGWGVASDEIEPKRRRQRAEVTVKRVGPDEAIPVLTKSEFLFDESICKGDSGGPVFASSTNAVLGVVSRGGNGNPDRGGPASTCILANNVATKLAPFHELIMDGFKRAGAEPQLEPQEDDGCSASRVGSRPSTSVSALMTSAAIALSVLMRRRRAIRRL